MYKSADLSRASSVLDYTSLPTTSSPSMSHPLEARPIIGDQPSQPRLPGSRNRGILPSEDPGSLNPRSGYLDA